MSSIVFKYFLVLFLLILSACASQTEHQEQQIRVSKAYTTLQQEQIYLQTLRDSLPIKIQQNIKLGLPPEQAESVEKALINMQETVVNVAQHNLQTQQAFLDSLTKYHP
jgi:2-C-methyl-D-erythritol 4-phosphate cytidylyltransferase